MKRLAKFLAPAVTVLALAGCGGSSHSTPAPTPAPTPPTSSCPQAASGHGSLGACAPKQRLGLTRPHVEAGPQFYDRSNNNPCVCGGAIRSAGKVGLIVKLNQGSFVDTTAAEMAGSARAHGLAVGGYDFDQNYTVDEARLFVSRARAAGILPGSNNTFPLYFDVEFGSFSFAGLQAQINYVRSQGYRVGIYTGNWYWAPHAGCRWPTGTVSAWLSGFPSAPVPCGTQGYNVHQFTDTPLDTNVFLGSLSQFHAFVRTTPPPPPSIGGAQHYERYPADAPARPNRERQSVMGWDSHGCQNPVRRPVCKITRAHLLFDLGRDQRLYAHDSSAVRADLHLGGRIQGLVNRLIHKGVVKHWL